MYICICKEQQNAKHEQANVQISKKTEIKRSRVVFDSCKTHSFKHNKHNYHIKIQNFRFSKSTKRTINNFTTHNNVTTNKQTTFQNSTFQIRIFKKEKHIHVKKKTTIKIQN